MEKTFANLLRHSKLASYDRRLNQVYHSPKQSKHRGDWGVKRNLPTVIRTPFVTIGQLDTVEHQTPWDSGHSQVAFVNRWKENFGNTGTSSTRPRPHLDNLATMTRSQFNHYIKHTITPDTVKAFHEELRANKITQDQVYDYLKISFNPEPATKMGPFYSTMTTTTDDDERMVQGRILNTQKGGYAVGIGGIVALLPKRLAVGIKKPGDRLIVRQFYVRRAYIDDQGKPQVIVSLQPKSITTKQQQQQQQQHIDINQTLSSPTSALPPTSPFYRKNTQGPFRPWSASTDDLFATTPPNNLDDLQLFLLGQDNTGRSKRGHTTSSSSSSSPSSPLDLDQHNQSEPKSQDELLEGHSVLMNRIIDLLKKGASKKESK
ncbi:hypothetical protein BC941DRAFT_411558 [Chlamydoabsidia padenii]|nr:hypothetical protein BC941DRAFT_411558 [Chlamydoabsidia padenii]